MATLNLQHGNHTNVTVEAVGAELRLHATASGAASDAVTVDAAASGELSYDLSAARTIRSTITGNVTSAAFTNTPPAGSWVWIITMDATGNHMLSGLPTVTRWLGGRSYADLDRTANATNILVYTWDGNELSVSLAWNGGLELDSFKIALSENGVYAVPVDAGDALDFADVQKPTGDAAVTFKKNGAGSDLTALTSFAAGDWLQVTVATLTTPTAVLIPRYVA